jgi:hypothetical protein
MHINHHVGRALLLLVLALAAVGAVGCQQEKPAPSQIERACIAAGGDYIRPTNTCIK